MAGAPWRGLTQAHNPYLAVEESKVCGHVRVNRTAGVKVADMNSDDRLNARIARLRWRQRLFLYGPLLGFAGLGLTVLTLNTAAVSGGGTEAIAPWVAGVVAATAAWCCICLWWAPAALCPRCRLPMGDGLLSPRNGLWMWFSSPRCSKCLFEPYRHRE